MNTERPILDSNLSADDFLEFYWLKSDLLTFCRTVGLSTAGGKLAIADRIAHFLRSGERLAPVSPQRRAPILRHDAEEEMTLNTTAPEGFRCTQAVRKFFERHAGSQFRFTVPLQTFIRDNPNVTFQEILDEWHRQRESKGAATSTISPQFEFNQFTRDYFAHPKNANRNRSECIAAWRKFRGARRQRKTT